MSPFRHLLRHHGRWAAWIAAAALLMKLLVPTGYMPVQSGGSIVLELCSGYGPEQMAKAMPGMAHQQGHHDSSDEDHRPCGFAGHMPPSLLIVDPILLVLGIAFAFAAVFRCAMAAATTEPLFLRPPTRAPPSRR